jgi:tetratricopeptide (TPR) repeat protein
LSAFPAQTVFFVAVALLAVSASDGTLRDKHLYAGATAFQRSDYEAALVEFKVALSLGAPEAAWYVGAALQKVGRADDAVETFQFAAKTFPASEDALLNFYFALACYDARLYFAADELLR